MEDYSYMCGECFVFCDNIDSFIHHVCPSNVEGANTQDRKNIVQKKDKIESGSSYHEVSEVVNTDSAAVQCVNEQIAGHITKNIKATDGYLSTGPEFSDLDGTEEDDVPEGGVGKKRKKYQAMADEYRVNRIMRDKDFKLGRTHLYNFKDTLGDWDERSTKLLIHLIQKYPKSHFLLPTRAERRLIHWENIHQEMETAGYTFTVLQLRMRWREVLQKYRWTVDYNDAHEIKKKCEYFDEMNELFGDWDKESTECFLKQMHQLSLENQKKKILRIGYVGWERITSALNDEGHRFSIDMVEARWRNMVTLYKTMVDHNALPNVEPQSVAYKDDLEKILNYVPKRRQIYEKVKGRSVKMERFPTNGIKVLLQAYKDHIDQFMDTRVKNTEVWDEIKQKLHEEGYEYSTSKLKEILNGIIKGFEKTQLHNSLPGAIRRDVSYYRELSEIYGTHGRWPHVQTSRTVDMRMRRKFRLRLQASQQLWSSEESRALLEIYPDVLEAHVNQNVSHHASDLWLQVAKAYTASGFPKRDVPEIAVHIGLLRMGYSQGNAFPFREEMRKVKETEEAVCYSPDVSKFTGDVEVMYWSHEAVKHLLELYLQHQASVASHSAGEVFAKIRDNMQELGYGYTKEQIHDHFKTLITQYRTRTSKLWAETDSNRKSCNPTGAPYLEILEKVVQLRRKLSLSWTSGVMPLSTEATSVVFEVACKVAEEMFQDNVCTDEKKMIPELINQIQSHIRTKKLLKVIPRTRQIRLHLVLALRRFHDGSEENSHVAELHKLLKAGQMENFFMNFKRQDVPVSTARSLKKRRLQSSKKPAGKKQRQLDCENVLSDSDSSDILGSSSAEHSKLAHKRSKQNVDDIDKGSNASYAEHSGEKVLGTFETVKGFAASKSVKPTNSELIEVPAGVGTDGFGKSKLSFEDKSKNLINTKVTTIKVISRKSDINCDVSTCSKPVVSFPESEKCIVVDHNCKLEQETPGIFEEHPEFSRPSTSGCGVDVLDTKYPNEDFSGELVEGKVGTGVRTKVIRTRSGRKTKFTFFSNSLSDNVEDDCDVNFPETSFEQKIAEEIELKDKSTQCGINVSIKRKRGRPRKSGESLSQSVAVNTENKKLVFKPRQHVAALSNSNTVSQMYERKNADAEDYDSPLSVVLERHRLERKKRENALLSILEKRQTNEDNVLQQMMNIFQNMKSIVEKKRTKS
ncbi:uncharacterized protein [Macrobrachium rosenbergii]|uniref:uncharacterized protein n=1 Tax=Macrobrachium rosenbergii TaxID=79674 RepID=UPI0034D40DE7